MANPPGVPVRAMIAEDEPIMRADLLARLARLWPELQIIAGASDGVEALALFAAHRPDVLFLDIEMPGLSGLEVARRLAGAGHIVFLSAHDTYAIAAFDQGAIDYMLKPYEDDRLARCLQRLRQRLDVQPAPMDQLLRELVTAFRPKEYMRWIKASRGSDIELIMVTDVQYFQSDTKYTSVHTCDREALIRRSIKDLAGELDPARFWQIHRSTIVNVEAIEAITRGLAETRVRLRTSRKQLAVSEAYRHLFRHM